MSLRLLGDNNPGYNWVFAKMVDVRIESSGVALPIQLGAEDIDLADGNQAWLAARFDVPPGAGLLQATVSFDDFGAFATPDESGSIDFRGSPMVFDIDPALLARNSHAVLQLQLDKMLVKTGRPDERVGLKNFILRY
jgi:hypothetical protein